jgi:uncharacterized protein
LLLNLSDGGRKKSGRIVPGKQRDENRHQQDRVGPEGVHHRIVAPQVRHKYKPGKRVLYDLLRALQEKGEFVTRIPAGDFIRNCISRLSKASEGYTLALSHEGPRLQFLSARNFVWKRAQIQIPSLPPALEGIRILHLSDLHLRRYWTQAYDHLIETVQNNPPDLILITGDFIDSRSNHSPAMPHLIRLLSNLRSKLGIYGILGNHDNGRMGRQLKNYNVRLLDNKRCVVPIRDGCIELIGAMRVRKSRALAELDRPVTKRPENSVRIFLAHYPDSLALAERWNPDLFLAGHTHGGQICLPGQIPILRHTHFPRAFCSGIFKLGQTWAIVNRGLGFATFPLRLFCPAEAIEITFRRQD